MWFHRLIFWRFPPAHFASSIPKDGNVCPTERQKQDHFRVAFHSVFSNIASHPIGARDRIAKGYPGPIATPSQLPHIFFFTPLTSTMASTWTEAQLQLAVTDLAKQDTPNYTTTSKKYEVPRKTLQN